MEQKIEALSEADALRIEEMRSWVREHYDPEARDLYDDLEGKLRLLDTIITGGWIEPSETFKLQCLGITFGDALGAENGRHLGRRGRRVRPGSGLARSRQDHGDLPHDLDLEADREGRIRRCAGAVRGCLPNDRPTEE